MSNNIHTPIDHYCATIYELIEDGINVTQANIAKRLNISRASVFEMLNKLESEGIIVKDKTISLTKSGLKHAQNVVSKHRLAERFLAEVLNLSWEEAHTEAGKWEHIISDNVRKKMEDLVQDPTTCPHGNPIPGKATLNKNEKSLVDIEPNNSFIILRIPESIETIPGELTRLYKNNVIPKNKGKLISKDDKEVNIEISNKKINISNEVAQKLKVEITS